MIGFSLRSHLLLFKNSLERSKAERRKTNWNWPGQKLTAAGQAGKQWDWQDLRHDLEVEQTGFILMAGTGEGKREIKDDT